MFSARINGLPSTEMSAVVGETTSILPATVLVLTPLMGKDVLDRASCPGVKIKLQVAPGATLTQFVASCVMLPASMVPVKSAFIFLAVITVDELVMVIVPD